MQERPGVFRAALGPLSVLLDAVAVVEPAVVEAAGRPQDLALHRPRLARRRDQLVPLRGVGGLVLSVLVPVGLLFFHLGVLAWLLRSRPPPGSSGFSLGTPLNKIL